MKWAKHVKNNEIILAYEIFSIRVLEPQQRPKPHIEQPKGQ